MEDKKGEKCRLVYNLISCWFVSMQSIICGFIKSFSKKKMKLKELMKNDGNFDQN